MKRTYLTGIACLLVGIVYFHCTSPSGLANNGGSEVVGKLVTKKGDAVNGAQVRAFKAVSGSDSFAFAHSVVTGTNGAYKFDALDSGLYYLECKAKVGPDSLFANINNVHNDTIAPRNQPPHIVDLHIDTMLPPGSISGQVKLDYVSSTNMSGVLCDIPGTSYMATTNDTGYFKMTNVPVGTYTMKFRFNSGGYSFVDTQVQNISVQSGDTSNIGTIKMHLSGDKSPPMPLGLKVSYDTLTGQVALSWNKVPVPDFMNYQVVWKDSNNVAGLLRKDSSTTTDTFFDNKITFTDTLGYSVLYSVECFDISGLHSDLSQPIIIQAKPPAGKTTVHLTSPDSAGLFDKIAIIATFTNITTPVKTITWTTSNGDSVHAINKNYGADTLKISFADTGKHAIYFKTIDNLGRTSKDSILVTIVQDKPVIKYLSPSQIINFGGTVQCSLAVSHKYGLCTLRVHLNGNTSPEIKSVGLGFDSVFSTGPALTWDSVKIKVTDSHGNSMSTGFSVTIIPPQPQNQWVLSPTEMINHHSWHASCVMNGMLYVIGGTKMQLGAGGNANIVQTAAVEAFDTLSKTWTTMDSLRNARYDFSACVVNNKIYIVGGIGKRGYVTIIEQYDPQANAWTIFDTTHIGQNQFLRAGSACCAVGNKIYLFGGRTLSADSSSNIACQNIFIYDFSNKKWSEDPSIHLNTARYDFQAVSLNGKIYLMGGLGVDDEPLKNIEIFDTISGMCTVSSNNLPEELNNFSAVAMNSNIYVIGGINSSTFSVLDSVRVFDPVSGSWSALALLPQPAYNTAAAVINNKIYLSGGLNDFNPPINETFDKTLYIYYP